jgi:hypothetical protein
LLEAAAGPELLFAGIAASVFFPALARIMGSFIELAPHGATGLIDLDSGLVSCLPELTGRRVGLLAPLRLGFSRAAGG